MLGEEAASCKYASVTIEYFDDKYKGYIALDEYDGAETVYVDFNRYFLDQFMSVCGSENINSQGIADLQKLVEEYRSNPDDYPSLTLTNELTTPLERRETASLLDDTYTDTSDSYSDSCDTI